MTYYRVVNNCMFGGSAKEILGDVLAPQTYWTPRWDSVLMMLQSTFNHYTDLLPKEDWLTTVYQLDKAIMADPPKEHAWAFTYHVDAGEQVLVEALEEPKIAISPSGILMKDLFPRSSEFIRLICEAITVERPINYAHGARATLNGKNVFVYANYNDESVDIAESTNGWQFNVLFKVKSIEQLESLGLKYKLTDDNEDALISLSYFTRDVGWE